MKILMTLSQLEVTGAEVYAVTLTESLINKGNEVFIASDTLTKKSRAKYFSIQFNKRKNLVQRFKQIKQLIKIIKENKIEIVHAHSRASSWSSNIACKICKIPMVTTVHGRQPVHISRKLIKGFGDIVLPVCENIKDQLINELGVSLKKIKLIRNPIEVQKSKDKNLKPEENSKKIISIIGRLSGPKEDVAYNLLDVLSKNKNYLIQLVGGKNLPTRFEIFEKKGNIKILGYVENVSEIILNSHVVIGAGRVAVEGILLSTPTIGIGESEIAGVLKVETIKESLASNFGDIGKTKEAFHNYSTITKMVEEALHLYNFPQEIEELKNLIASEFSKEKISEAIEEIYKKLIKKK